MCIPLVLSLNHPDVSLQRSWFWCPSVRSPQITQGKALLDVTLNCILFSFSYKTRVTNLLGSWIYRKLDQAKWKKNGFLMQERPRQLYPIVPFAGAEAVPVLFLFLHLPRECLGHTHCTRHPPVACSTYCFPGHSSVEGDGRGRGLLSPEVSAWRLFLGHTTSLKPQQTRNMWIKIIVKYILPNFPRVPREAELHFPQCSVADLL